MKTAFLSATPRLLAAAAFAVVSAPLHAHPWHGAGGGLAAGFAHPFLGLDHLLAMLAVGLWAAQLGGRWLWALPLAFVTSMVAGAALGFAGFALPLTEPLVAASVLMLGLLVAVRARLPFAGVAMIAAFAIFHGLAHSSQWTAPSGAIVYACGFVAATAALHVAGIGLGLILRTGRIAAHFAGIPIALAGCWLLAGAFV